jgi:CubicO group peptidase (beta-lactamase class C family)
MSKKMSKSQNETPELQAKNLVLASWDGNLEKVKALVSDGIDVNAQIGPGLTALHCAKLRGNEEIHEWLLENDAKPDIEMPDRDQIADMIFKKNADPDSPGGALAVVRDGSLVFTSCYGLANLEHKVPIAPTTVFHFGSVAKQFVGFAISTLVQQGKISLEDDIRKYIPELHEFDPALKIANLLHHTSGLRDWPGTLCLSGWSMDDVITFDHIITMAFHQKGLNFDTGSEHLYSNTGYILLTELVQRITGQTFRKWAKTNIFDPLEMTSSHFHDDHTELVPGKGYGYELKGDKFHSLPDNLAVVGSGALHSSIEDMAKWAINLDTHKVGGESVFDVMYQQGVLNNGEPISYASGLDIREHRGAKTIDHGGGGAGFTSLVLYFPEHHFSAIVIYNINSDVYGALYDIADIYLGDKLEQKKKRDPDQKEGKHVDVPIAMLDKYIGTYKVFPAWYFTISREGSQLMALETNQEIRPLTAVSETEFPVAAWNSAINFNIDDDGQVSSFNFLGIKCPKVEEGPTPTFSPLTEDFIGDYYCEEVDTRYTIAIENDELVAKHRRHGTSKLTPAWKDNFRGDLWFMRSVEFNRNEKGIVDAFSVTQWQSRNHRFVKIKPYN